MTEDIIIECLKRANSEELGLVVTVSNPNYFAGLTRKVMRDFDAYKNLIICIPSIPETVFFVQRTVELENADVT